MSSEAAPLPVEEPNLQSTTMNDQFPFPIPPSGTRMSPRATTLHPQILKMLGLPPEQLRDASSGGVNVSETGVCGWPCTGVHRWPCTGGRVQAVPSVCQPLLQAMLTGPHLLNSIL